jgi:hypothetical protein
MSAASRRSRRSWWWRSYWMARRWSSELAGESRAVESEGGEGWDQKLGAGGGGEEVGFKEWNAVEAPGGVGEFLDELSFGGVGGLILVDELAAVLFVRGWIFGGEDGDAGR